MNEEKTRYILVKEFTEFKTQVFVPFKDLMFSAVKNDDNTICIKGIVVGAHKYTIVINPFTSAEHVIEDFKAKTPEELIVKLELNRFVYD